MEEPNVVGCLVSDKGGSCVGAKGSLLPYTSAYLTNIFDCALKMSPDVEIQSEGETYLVPDCPMIVIETQTGNLVISNIDDFSTTLAITHNNITTNNTNNMTPNYTNRR